jgi:uncharacterized protein (DUF1778 family)
MAYDQVRTKRLNIRATARQERLIRLGAAHRGVNVTSFILESACAQAEQTLAEKQVFELTSKDWSKFMELLEASPREIPRLRKLFAERTVLDRK